MIRRLGSLLVVVGALAVVSAASAAYPTPFAVQGSTALPSADGSLQFVALKVGSDTRVAAMDTRSEIVMARTVPGAFGIARLTQNGLTGGLFHDGSAFVLQSVGLQSTSRFMIVGAKDLVPRTTIALKGTFGFDALSPDASKLYLIQHTSTQDIQHYANPGGYPFIHALDTVRGVAHCIGVPWRGDQNAPWDMRLALRVEGTSLAVNQQDGTGFVAVDLSSWKISYLNGSGG